ncbi:kinase-like domain-containing protein [Schizophyllum commune]
MRNTLPGPTNDTPNTASSSVSSVDQSSSNVRRKDLRIVRKLGSGSSGKVYLVRDTKSGNALALKIIKKPKKEDAGACTRIFREHKVLQALRTARWTMPLLAHWEDATSFHLLMPFYERDLDVELRRQGGKLSPDDAMHFMAQLLIALDEVHAHGVVHRDVKPANIFLDAFGRLILGDFGLARAFAVPPLPAQRATLPVWLADDAAATDEGELRYLARTRCGTPAYVAPETYLGMAVSFSVDLWAAAVTLFVMLCGREPWRLSKPDDKPVDLQVMNDPLSFAGCGVLSEASMRLLRKMLLKDPDERLTAMAAIEVEPFFIKINWAQVRLRNDAEWRASDTTVGEPAVTERVFGPLLLPPVLNAPAAKGHVEGDLTKLMDGLRVKDGMNNGQREG